MAHDYAQPARQLDERGMDCVPETHPTEELRYAANYLSEMRDALEAAQQNWGYAAKRWDTALNEIERWKDEVAPIDPMISVLDVYRKEQA